MMLLSRVAERIYWAARYLQRVESAARIVDSYTNLLMDLPRDINISWFNLVELNNGQEAYEERYSVRDERNVVKFLLADDTNSSSMLICLSQVRENLRTTRDVIPENAWELINELSSFAKDSIANGGLSRSKRQEFLTQVVNQCQMIQGYIASAMSHDAVWYMWNIGRALERADMTTRILEAGAGVLLKEGDKDKIQAPLVIWGSVLRSSSADHAYRRSVSATVQGKKVAKFLLYDKAFPRSVNYCLIEIKKSVKQLPKQKKILVACKNFDALLDQSYLGEQLSDEFLKYINNLQLELAGLHKTLSETWFVLD